MEFRPSATLYGVRLFDGSSESRKSFAIGHCKCRQRVVVKQYRTNRIVLLVPLLSAYNADFSVQIVPLAKVFAIWWPKNRLKNDLMTQRLHKGKTPI